MSYGICPSCGRRCSAFKNNIKCQAVEKREATRRANIAAKRELRRIVNRGKL